MDERNNSFGVYGVNFPSYDPYANKAQLPTKTNAYGAVTGGLALADTVAGGFQTANEADLIDNSTESTQRDPAGRTIYNLGDDYNRITSIKPQGATGAEVGSQTLKGAAAGATIGSAVPVIGTAVGAAAGAVIGAGSSLIGGAVRKRRQARKRNIGMQRLDAAQDTYNLLNQGDLNRENAMLSYYNNLNS